MSQTTNAVIAELMDRRLLNDVDDDLHQEIADAVIKAARLSRPDTAEARLREALAPFAKMASAMYVSGHCGGASPEDWPDNWFVSVQGGDRKGNIHHPQQHGGYLKVADFRRAAKALSPPSGGDEAKKSEGDTIVAPYNPCLAKLRTGEPFFVLLGRDKQAPVAVIAWADARELAEGKSDWTEQAREVAATMAAYSGTPIPSEPSPPADRREIVRQALCCPEGCMRPDDCWSNHRKGMLQRERQVTAILAALDGGR